MERLTNEPKCLFFDTSSHGIQNLVFETPRPLLERNTPAPTPELSSPYPESLCIEDYFYTSASLDNATTVSLCEGSYKGKVYVTGLVFTYSNGREACVGQIRRDYLSCPLQLITSPMLWLGFSLENREPRVAKIETISSPSDTSSLEWLAIPWTGQLDWWFSARQCKVYHKEQASPATRQAFGRIIQPILGSTR